MEPFTTTIPIYVLFDCIKVPNANINGSYAVVSSNKTLKSIEDFDETGILICSSLIKKQAK